MSELHPNLLPLPSRMKTLAIDKRGYPVPWFVEWFHADGSTYENPEAPHGDGDYPDFRVVDSRKLLIAYREKRCWVCGGFLGKYFAFVIGPMCAVNRVSSELPSHRECARFSARNCPFLTKPQVERRMNDLPEGYRDPAGNMIRRNPGVTLVWLTNSYQAFPDDNNRPLFEIGPPLDLEWYAEGRIATRAEILASIESGMPLLRQGCPEGDEEGMRALDEAYAEALKLVPGMKGLGPIPQAL